MEWPLNPPKSRTLVHHHRQPARIPPPPPSRTLAFHKNQFVVDRLDYQRASHDVYNRKAVGLLALQAAASAPVPVPQVRQGSGRRLDGMDGGIAGGEEV